MRYLVSVMVLFLFLIPGVSLADDESAWIEYPAATLKVRQQKGHAPLISTTAIRTDDGIAVISDFGGGGEYIRCFDTFTETFQPVGSRVCWRR